MTLAQTQRINVNCTQCLRNLAANDRTVIFTRENKSVESVTLFPGVSVSEKNRKAVTGSCRALLESFEDDSDISGTPGVT